MSSDQETQPDVVPASVPAPRKRVILPYVCLAIFLVTFVSCPLFILSLYLPPPAEKDVTLIIPKGSSVQDIAKILDEKGLLIHKALFRISSRFMAKDQLKAGEYIFPAGMNVLDLTRVMKEGQTVLRQVTIPEGLTSYEVAERLAQEKTLSGSIDTLPAEGSLLPETYHYSYGDSRSNFIQRMQNEQKKLLEELWKGRAQNLPIKTPEDAVILASIVEKETGVKASERAMVASVFVNRLRRSMPLQSDPTVIYALTRGKGKLERPLLRKDWSLDSPMNTYLNAGLPPTPICNPGRAALEAVLHPEDSNYLYFVADGSGGHAFASTLDEHNHNVARWIKVRQQTQ